MVKVEKMPPKLGPPPERRKAMPEKTEAQKRAQKKYMSSFVEIKVRMTPEKRSIIQDHARTMGESTTVFINRAIDQTMAQEATGGSKRAVDAWIPKDIATDENAVLGPSEGRREGIADGD